MMYSSDVEQAPYSIWYKTESYLITMTGCNQQQYNFIYRGIQRQLHPYYQRQLYHNNKHEVLSAHNMLLLTLYWLYRYQPHNILSHEFNITETATKSITHDVTHMIHQCLYHKLIFPPSPASSDCPSDMFPHAKCIVDSTWISVPDTSDQIKRPLLYHPKAVKHSAMKVQISSDFDNMICHVSDVVYGSVADVILYDNSSLCSYVTDDCQGMGDNGYIGRNNLLTPYKRNMRAYRDPLSHEWCRRWNRELKRVRSAVEGVNHRVKVFSIVGDIYRDNYDHTATLTIIVQTVCALVNLLLHTHPIRLML